MASFLCIASICKWEFDFLGEVKAVAGNPLIETFVEFLVVDVVVGLALAGLDTEDLGEPVLVGGNVEGVEFDADSACMLVEGFLCGHGGEWAGGGVGGKPWGLTSPQLLQRRHPLFPRGDCFHPGCPYVGTSISCDHIFMLFLYVLLCRFLWFCCSRLEV